ncbi:MAG: DUF3892 domain-containing protein [Deltaproteobacteria bacterium]|nr:DUF3892 domain-containing protein [Deltaproteobacteria bacterium]
MKNEQISKKKQIIAVQKDKKGTIVAYCIDGIGWVSKDEGIELAEKRIIDAVVATSRRGNLFLRTRPDLEVENNLENLG